MKVIGYFIYGKPYCLSCTESLDLDIEDEELEPIFSGDIFPYPLHCEECDDELYGREDFFEPEYEIIEDEGEDEEIEEKIEDRLEEEREHPILTCDFCEIKDFCPDSGDPRNVKGKCLPGFFYDIEEEEYDE
jgi:hypothetical protein